MLARIMHPIRKVAILIHENEREPLDPRFIAAAMASAWRAMGIEAVVIRGVDERVEADLWLPHVDLTIRPDDYTQFFDARPHVVNRQVVDISKKRISSLLVHSGDGYRGPVIVKSNENYGGRPELRLLGDVRKHGLPAWRDRLGRLRNRLGLGFDPRGRLDPSRYPIFASPDELPAGTFESPEFVVERFVPERDGALYVLRSCGFGGGETFNVRTVSKLPVVKARAVADRVEVPVPHQLEAIRARHGIDFGKLDYVLHEGAVQLFDVNPTPTFGRFNGEYNAEQRKIARLFAHGLIDRFEKKSPALVTSHELR
jgi:hypothetical protein